MIFMMSSRFHVTELAARVRVYCDPISGIVIHLW